MKSIVLGVTGKIASGKSTIASSFAKTMGWPYVSFTDHVRAVARNLGLDDSQREILQQVGGSLVNEDYEGFCRAVLAKVEQWQPGKPLVINSIHHLQVKKALEKIVAPSEFLLGYIEVDDQSRWQQLRAEGLTDAERLKRIESAPTEIEVESDLLQAADFVLNGKEPLPLLIEELKTKLSLAKDNSDPPSELAEQGRCVYEKLKDTLEPQHHGRFVAIEPWSERYFLGDTGTEALVAAHTALPDARFFLMRVGYETAHKLGGYAVRIR